jgi:hypothetical protein
MKTLLISALMLSAAGPLFAREVNEPSPAEAACDEQVGEFQRDGAKVYCDVNGIVYEGREELHARAAPMQREQEIRPKLRSREKQQTDGLKLLRKRVHPK